MSGLPIRYNKEHGLRHANAVLDLQFVRKGELLQDKYNSNSEGVMFFHQINARLSLPPPIPPPPAFSQIKFYSYSIIL